MNPVKNYPIIPPPGLNEKVEASGIILANEGGVWVASDADAAAAIASSYVPLPHVLAGKEAKLADARWQRETGGFMFQPSGEAEPHRFVSTREAMGPMIGAVLALQAGVFSDPTMWKTADGNFVRITAADVVPLFKAFVAHVAMAFVDEAAKQDQARKEPDWKKIDAIQIEAAAAVPP